MWANVCENYKARNVFVSMHHLHSRCMKSSEIPDWLSRTELLVDENEISRLLNAHVLVVGLGGVGGICAEMIARAGIGKITLIDADTVEPSNRNRQLPALISTNGKLKSEVVAHRLKDISDSIQLDVLSSFITPDNVNEVLENNRFTYVADCIDTLSPKVALMSNCITKNIPIISSMGAGGKLDPSQVKVVDISETHSCLLSYYVRKKLHQKGIYNGVKVVWSSEQADKKRIKLAASGPKKSVIGTISYMPAIFGCFVASEVIRGILKMSDI